MITTRQAMALVSDVPEDFVEELDQLERDYQSADWRQLLREWVRLWAPVVAAAEAQADARVAWEAVINNPLYGDQAPPIAPRLAYNRAGRATVAAVRAARGDA